METRNVRVHCSVCSEQRVAPLVNLVVDDSCGVYRVRCPECQDLIVGDLTVQSRHALLQAGAVTLAQLLDRARQQLSSDERIWRYVLAD